MALEYTGRLALRVQEQKGEQFWFAYWAPEPAPSLERAILLGSIRMALVMGDIGEPTKAAFTALMQAGLERVMRATNALQPGSDVVWDKRQDV